MRHCDKPQIALISKPVRIENTMRYTDNNLNLASLAQRILTVMIDMVTYFIIWILVTVSLIHFGFDQTYTTATGEQFILLPLITLVPVFWGYYILTEYPFQKTLGKLLTKTKVVSLTGHRPTLKQIILRTLCRSIPFEYFSYLVTVEGIHDKLSKTRVVTI